MRNLLLLFILCTALCQADSWAPPKARTYTSPNGEFQFRVVPAKITSARDYWQDKAEGSETPGMSKTSVRYCRGRLSRLEGGGKHRQWEARLVNKVSPTQAIVSNNGQFVVTFDNWHEVGYGPDVVAVYAADGSHLRSYSLEQLLDSEVISKIETSTSSRWWLKGAWIAEDELFLRTSIDKILAVNLASGAVQEGQPSDALAQLSESPTQEALETCFDHRVEAPQTMQGLVERQSLDLELRLWAALCLGRHPSSRRLARQILEAPQAKEQKGELLSHLGSIFEPQEAEAILLPLLDGRLKYEASEGLAGALSPARIHALLKAATPSHQSGAIAATIHNRDPQAIPILLEIAESKSEFAADAFRSATEISGPSEIAPRLVKLHPEQARVRRLTALFFNRHRYPESVPWLVDGLSRAPDKHVEDFREALVRQTGIDIGIEPKSWGRWLAASELERRALELEAGDATVLGRLAAWLEQDKSEKARSLVKKALKRFPRHLNSFPIDPLGATGVSADGHTLLASSGAWDLKSGQRISHTPEDVIVAQVNATGDRFVGGGRYYPSIELRSTDGQKIRQISHLKYVTAFAFNPGGDHLATAGDNGVVSLWNADDGKELVSFELEESVFDLHFVTGKPWLLSRHYQSVRLLDCETGKVLAQSDRSGVIESANSEFALLLDQKEVLKWNYRAGIESVAKKASSCTLADREIIVGYSEGRCERIDTKRTIQLTSEPRSLSADSRWTVALCRDSRLYVCQDEELAFFLRPVESGRFSSGPWAAKLLPNARLLVFFDREARLYQLPPAEIAEGLSDAQLQELANSWLGQTGR